MPIYRKKFLSKLDSYHQHHYLDVDLELDVDIEDDLDIGRRSLSVMEEVEEIEEDRGRRGSRRKSRQGSKTWLEDLERRRDSRKGSKSWTKDVTPNDVKEEENGELQITGISVEPTLRERRSSSFR